MGVLRPQIRRILVVLAIAIGSGSASPAAKADDGPHTFDGKHAIGTIDLTMVYFVPKDPTPLTDRRERVDYFRNLIEAFHRRESAGRSRLNIQVHPWPLIVPKTARQTGLNQPWRSVSAHAAGKPPEEPAIGNLDRPTPVSYRVDAVLEDGQSVELWGYFQVNEQR